MNAFPTRTTREYLVTFEDGAQCTVHAPNNLAAETMASLDHPERETVDCVEVE